MDKIEFTIRRAEPSDAEDVFRILKVPKPFGEPCSFHFLLSTDGANDWRNCLKAVMVCLHVRRMRSLVNWVCLHFPTIPIVIT